MAKKVTKLDKAKAQIVLDHPFFASILLKKTLIEDNKQPTLQVDPRGQIYYNSEFIESLTVPQVVWALCHEIGHIIGQHSIRRGSREADKWNYAGDAWINDMLNDAKVGETIPGTVNIPGSKDLTTEKIYDTLPASPPKQKGQGKGKGEAGWMDGDPMGQDVQDGKGVTEAERKEIEGMAKIDLAEAAQVAKMRGKMPGSLQKIVDSILEVKTPWYDILERYMVGFTKAEPTWTKANRRYIGQGVHLPSCANEPSMGEMVVQIDISGSIDAKQLAYYGGHLSRIIDLCKPAKVHVMYTDTEVQHYQEFEQGEDVKLTFYSGGGTDMVAGFKKIDDLGIQPEVVVTLTDGYTPFPKKGTDYPAIWCISSDVVAPDLAGETVHFEME